MKALSRISLFALSLPFCFSASAALPPHAQEAMARLERQPALRAMLQSMQCTRPSNYGSFADGQEYQISFTYLCKADDGSSVKVVASETLNHKLRTFAYQVQSE